MDLRSAAHLTRAVRFDGVPEKGNAFFIANADKCRANDGISTLPLISPYLTPVFYYIGDSGQDIGAISKIPAIAGCKCLYLFSCFFFFSV